MHPPKFLLPSSSVYSSVLSQGLNPNDIPNPVPATAASPEDRRVNFLNYVRSDMGRIIGEAP